jgi:Tfp pilus assembly protein PilV
MIAPPVLRPAPPVRDERGFTFVEVLVAGALLTTSLLAMCAVFLVAYSNATSAGKGTVGVAAAAQMLEDIRALPFETVATLDDFDTDDPSTLPANDPSREVARRWRYALAGEGVGWSFSDTEKTRWTDLTAGSGQLRGTGTINVAALSTTLAEITVTVAVPGRFRPIVLMTRVARI